MTMYSGLVEIVCHGKDFSHERMPGNNSFKMEFPDISAETVGKILQEHHFIPNFYSCKNDRKEVYIGSHLIFCEYYIIKSVLEPDTAPEYHVELATFEEATRYEKNRRSQLAQTGYLDLFSCTNVPAILQKEQKRMPIKYLHLGNSCRGKNGQYEETFRAILNLPDLRGLEITFNNYHEQITGNLAEFLKKIPRLEILSLLNVTPDVFPVIQQMTRLKALYLEPYQRNQYPPLPQLDFLKDMDSLEYLELSFYHFDAESLIKPETLKWLNRKNVRKPLNT